MLFRSLTVILGHADMLLDTCRDNDAVRSSLLDIQNAAGAGARVASDLLAISQRQSLHPAPVDLNDVVVHARDRHFPVELHLSLCIWSLGLVGRRVICLVPTLEER